MGVRFSRYIVFSFILAGFFIVVFFPEYSQIKELREKERALENKISQLEKEIEELNIEKEALKNSDYREFVAREKLGLLKEGEYIVKIEE